MANIRKPKSSKAAAETSETLDVIGDNARAQLLSVVERIERLEEEKSGIADDMKEVYAEAKGNGYAVKIIRKVIRLRKQDAAKRSEEEALVDLYWSAIHGADTPFVREIQAGDTADHDEDE